MEKYIVNFNLLVIRLTPSFLRMEPLTAWFVALFKPLSDLNYTLVSFISAVRLTVSYNSQRLIFETYLNDLFDPVDRGIVIENTFKFVERLFIFYKIELQTENQQYNYLDSEVQPPKFIYSHLELGLNYDFIVKVPVLLVYNAEKMNEIILNTKLAGKRYEIQTY